MYASYIYTMTTYLANLVGALSLSITDRLGDAAVEVAPPAGELSEALVVIAMENDISIKRLAQRLRLSHPGTVRMVDRLEKAGWVTRGPGQDGRTLGLVLTDAGRQTVAQFCALRAGHLEGLLKVLTPKERRELRPIAEKLLRALTTDLVAAYANCRMCDTDMCKARGCPVEAEARARFTIPHPDEGAS